MSNTLKIRIKENGNVAEVNRSTAGEMVANGFAEYVTEADKADKAPQQEVKK